MGLRIPGAAYLMTHYCQVPAAWELIDIKCLKEGPRAPTGPPGTAGLDFSIGLARRLEWRVECLQETCVAAVDIAVEEGTPHGRGIDGPVEDEDR
jgi:hypothetical protein